MITNSMNSDCIFCRIIKGNSSTKFVYKDNDLVAFHNIRPDAPVHVLIVPVEHIESINALEERHSAVISKMMLKAKEIAQELGIKDSGYKLIINVGSGAGQVVFHLHIHLIGAGARFEGYHFFNNSKTSCSTILKYFQ